MSTRSAIGMVQNDGSFRFVYCHYDGYPEHNGKILKQSYSNPAKVEALLDNGDLSSLENTIDECEFYARDRGEDDVGSLTFDSLDDMFETYNWSEYFYLFKDGNWEVCDDRKVWEVL